MSSLPLARPAGGIRYADARKGWGRAASDWRRAVAAVSERRVAEGRALYTERSPAELYRGARSSERERYARQASRLGAERPFPAPVHRGTVPRGTLGCIAWSLRPLVPVIVVSVPWLSHDGRLILTAR